jgi:hypothetical protein
MLNFSAKVIDQDTTLLEPVGNFSLSKGLIMENTNWEYDSVIEGDTATWILWVRTRNNELQYNVTRQPATGTPSPPDNNRPGGVWTNPDAARRACGDRGLEGQIRHWGGGLAKLKNPFVDSPGYKGISNG